MIQHYNMGNYFQSVYLSRGDVTFASPYMTISKPLLVIILKTCYPKSIKPNNNKRVNIINKGYNFANKKGKPLKNVWLDSSGVINRIGIPSEIIIINIHYTIKKNVKYL